MTQRVTVVIPHGIGIGDLVNTRPLLQAVRRARPRTQVIAPRSLAWLADETENAIDDVPWLSAWQRPKREGWAARLGARTRSGQLAPLARTMPAGGLARMLQFDLERRGYEVINLLADFSSLDLDNRWTPGPWNTDRRHVVDLLAETLENRGVVVPPNERAPRLSLGSEEVPATSRVILNPQAGSSLKEPSVDFWMDLAARLREQGVEPAVLAAPDRSVAGSIVRRVPDIEVLASRDLRQVSSWIASARGIVSPDTGLLHIAAALGVPHVGVFGSTDPAFLGPYPGGEGVMIESRAEKTTVCRGCWTGQLLPSARCALYEPGTCLDAIDVEEVLRAAKSLMHQAAGRGTPRAMATL